jgi:ribosomal protein L44E
VLGEQLSVSLRESLIEQIATINSADEAAAWAHRNLPAKNTLTAPDAKIVEEHFQARLAKISEQTRDEASNAASVGPPHTVSDQSVVSIGRSEACDSNKPSAKAKKQSRREVIGALGKTVRLRDKDHRRFVLRQACLVCGRVPSDPHHLTSHNHERSDAA